MTAPLIILAVMSIMVAWGWPVWDARASLLEHHIHHALPNSVLADFGHVLDEGEVWPVAAKETAGTKERHLAHEYHHLAGNLALLMVALGIVFASLLYYYHRLDPAQAKQEFPAIHSFLSHKWRFDELYSVMLVRPSLVVAHWFRWFDLTVIDGIIHILARCVVGISKINGQFDNGIIDGLVNLIGNVIYGVGAGLRGIQTGFLRNYVLFLVLAAVGIFLVLSYVVSLASTG
jgi:NADH-quinone oxidoreductase subunit L